MTNANIRDVKRKLLAERERVVESLHRNAEHALVDITDTTKDTGDRASASHDRDVVYLLQDSDARRLRMINEVLRRIDEGAYGLCERCEQPISMARLEAIPWTATCVRCQERADLRNSPSRESVQTGDEKVYGAA
jgi:DnaK suppressor protein